MKNPPRTTKIRGQKHLLAYITPDEAKLLKAMGGSGEKVHGIPAFYGGFEGDEGRSQGGFGGRGRDYDGGGGNERDSQGRDRALEAAKAERAARDAARQATERAKAEAAAKQEIARAEAARQAELNRISNQSPGAMGGAIGSAYQTAPSVGRGFDVNLAKAMSRIAAAPASQRLGFTDRQIMKAYQTGKAPGITGFFGMPLGRTQGYKTFKDPTIGSVYGSPKGIFSSFQNQAAPLGALGFASGIFGLDPYVTTGFTGMGDGPDAGGRDDTVPAEYNPVTGQQNQCPDGYVFDEDLQACRMSADLPSFGTPAPSTGPYEAGDYARMGLLDIAPMGMSLFADRYGIPQMDFDTANLAFRRAGATRPQYFRQAPDLPGYTLLS